jgi:protein-tyrosine kinase
MAKKPKGKTMKDNYFSEDMSDFDMDDALIDAPVDMGHSLRPRRGLAEQAKRRLLDQSLAAPNLEFDLPPEEEEAPAPMILEEAVQPRAYGWNDIPMITEGLGNAMSPAPSTLPAEREDASGRAFDLLRTRLRQTTLENGWVNIGITGPTAGCGSTFTATNLAQSLSRIAGSRSVLMDFNLRDPGVAQAFNLPSGGMMENYLSGAVADQDHLLRVSDTLALGLNQSPSRNAAEVMQDPKTHATLARMQQDLNPDLVIYDLPPMLAYDDVSAFLPQLDAILVVSDGTQTISRDLLECERMLDGQVPLLGVVLNRARKSSIRRFR